MTNDRHGHESKHDAAVWAADEAVRVGAERAAGSPYRLAYHFAPLSGWMNDPNGLIWWRGRYHLFFQHNPYAPRAARQCWGHAISDDLVRWTHLPVALAPSEVDAADGGCWSGSAVDDAGTLTLMYTLHAGDRTPKQVQCIATTTDGVRFAKDPRNPVIAEIPPGGADDFRDPKAWRQGGEWFAIIGNRTPDPNPRGRVVIYRSPDLRRWSFHAVAAESRDVRTEGTMWECPDLFPVGRGKHILLNSPYGQDGGQKSVMRVGTFDPASGKFTTDYIEDADWGADFYAPQTLLDGRGRRVMIGWMQRWGNSSPTEAFGWSGALTLPTVITLGPDDRPRVNPVPELESLRGRRASSGPTTIVPDRPQKLADGECLEIIAEFDEPKGPGRVGLIVRASADGAERTLVAFDAATRRLTVDRTASGNPDEAMRNVRGDVMPRAADGILRLRVFLDRSSVEVFANDGVGRITSRVYPSPLSTGVLVFAEGGPAHLRSCEVWEMGAAVTA